MKVVKGLKEVVYPKWKKPKKKGEWEIDVIFYDTYTKKEETVRIPYRVLKELHETLLKEEK